MKNKVESMIDHEMIEEKDDVIRLLKGLKQLAFETVDVQCEHWTLCQSMKNASTMKQQGDEALVAHHRCFIGMVNVTESQWGMIAVPTKIGADKDTRNKFLACIFIAGVDRKKHRKLINELNNQCLSGNNNYPTTLEGALNVVSHYKCDGTSMSPRGETTDEGIGSASFAQLNKKTQKKQNVTCYKCKQKGHNANECNEESDSDENDLVSGSSMSSVNSRRNNCTGWSGQ